MGKPIPIWKPLGIVIWWVLLAALVLEIGLRIHFHIPGRVPSLWAVWIALQAAWLRKAEPRSRSIFIYTAAFLAWYSAALPYQILHGGILGWILSGVGSVGWIVGFFMFASEMENHFDSVDHRTVNFNGFMVFFFGFLYFQYRFHQLYKEQTDPALSISPQEG